MPTALVIAAAGAGTRLGAGLPKALAPLADGRTLLHHCLASVAAARAAGLALDAVVVLTPPAEADAGRVAAEVDAGPRLDVPVHCVPGGVERADSVRAGLAAASRALADLAPAGAPRRVLVHDAARALTPPSVFAAVTAALETGAVAVVPGLPLTDTVKQVTSGRGGVDVVAATPARAGLRAIQTPQGFDLDTLLAAHEAVRTDPTLDAAALTDDAMVMEAAGHEVVVVPGDPAAFKVTAPADLDLARLELAVALPRPDVEVDVARTVLRGVGVAALHQALDEREHLGHVAAAPPSRPPPCRAWGSAPTCTRGHPRMPPGPCGSAASTGPVSGAWPRPRTGTWPPTRRATPCSPPPASVTSGPCSASTGPRWRTPPARTCSARCCAC